MSPVNHPTRRETFLAEVNQALENNPYAADQDMHLHLIYCVGLLRELLVYSAIDQMEVRAHVRHLAHRDRPERTNTNNNTSTRTSGNKPYKRI